MTVFDCNNRHVSCC
ncbi:MAG: hypothetical protein DMF03_03570 [Verrucomicrobia bacterium]|nr:MAG: hypothetical protein DMF03_03570 [Verrucomicrobiota bacterium]